MYKVCDSCGELFLSHEEHKYIENFGYVCFLCVEEGFENPASEKVIKDLENHEIKEKFIANFPKINLNS